MQEERRSGTINLALKFHESEVKATEKFTRLETKVDNLDDDIKDIKSYLERLVHKIETSEDEVWDSLETKSGELGKEINILKNDKAKFVAGVTTASSILAVILEKLIDKAGKLL